MRKEEDIRQKQKDMAQDVLGIMADSEQKKIRSNQEDLSINILDDSPEEVANLQAKQKGKNFSTLSRFYSLVGAFVIGTAIVFGLTFLIADFLEAHSVFADALVRILVAIIGGISSVVIELVRTRQK